MTDLEDRFFKKNIPGKYSQWDDHDDRKDGQRREGFIHYDENDDVETTNPNTTVRSATGQHRTGAKGVLNDYKQHKQLQNLQKQIELEEKNVIIDRITNGSYLENGDLASISITAQNAKFHNKEDQDFLLHYRKQRLQQMKREQHQNSHIQKIPQYPKRIIDIQTPHEFSSLIDEDTHPLITVIIHMYEPHIKECVFLNQHLDRLAYCKKETLSPSVDEKEELSYELSSLTMVRYAKVKSTILKKNFDEIGLPVLIVYRGGNLVKNWTRVTDYLPSLKYEDVRDLLKPVIQDGVQGVKEFLSRESDKAKKFDEGQNNKATESLSAAIDNDVEYDSEDAELDELMSDFHF